MKNKWFWSLFKRRVTVAVLLLLQLAFLVYLLYSQSLRSQLVAISLNLISFAVALHIVVKRDKGAYKLAWAFLVLLFPLFGGLFYLVCRLQRSAYQLSRRAKVMEDTKGEYLLPGDRLAAFQSAHPDWAASGAYLQNYAGFPVYENTHVTYLTPGEKFRDSLLEELEKAEEYIFFEYFIIQQGAFWDPILDVLKRKAAQGVKVRVMYDDVGCILMLPKDYKQQLESFGIECLVFNPFRPIVTVLQNNRDHRKITVIDGKVAFTGGINLADEYINAYAKHGYWKDAAVKLEGDAAWSLTMMFLQMWHLTSGREEDCSAYYPWGAQLQEKFHDGWVQPYADTPLDSEYVGEHVYMQIFSRAKEYLYITTPYLMLDDSMLSALELAAKSGVDVRILTPHIWDKRLVHMTTRSYYADLLRAGVRVYEFTPGFVHAKTVVCDDTIATVGTVNLDYRSLYLHMECGVRMYNTGAVQDIRDDFLKTLETCREMTLEACHVNPVYRLMQQILRMFAPLM